MKYAYFSLVYENLINNIPSITVYKLANTDNCAVFVDLKLDLVKK